MAAVAFIGLGTMGFPMAGHLQRAGHDTTVYNRTSSRAGCWLKTFGGCSAKSPRDAAQDNDVVFCCVGNDDDVREVTLGSQGVLHGMQAGAVLVDHTSASAGIARELASEASARGVAFIDAPVSGGQSGAESGTLTVMAGGNAEHIARVEPLIRCYAAKVERIGPNGHGQLAKMVNQICVAGLIQSLAEGLHFGIQAGLDIDKVISVISKGAAQSWQMDNRHRSMLSGDYDHGFAVDWMRKDLDIALREARQNGARLPVAALIDQFYAEIQAVGGGRWDTSSLLRRLEAEKSGGANG